MDIKLIPLEKMILDGKEIRLGEKKKTGSDLCSRRA